MGQRLAFTNSFDEAKVKLTNSQARFLLNTHYAEIYGAQIRYETPRSIRVKIMEIEAHMDPLRLTQPMLYRAMARQCIDFERIGMLIEKLS